MSLGAIIAIYVGIIFIVCPALYIFVMTFEDILDCMSRFCKWIRKRSFEK